jgi:hypothetical protein
MIRQKKAHVSGFGPWIVLLGLAATALAACAGPDTLRPELQKLASAINGDFEQVRLANDQLVKDIDARYADLGSLNLDTAVLATPEGGAFKVYGDNKFFYKSVRTGSCYYYSPGKPADPAALREIRIMTYLEPLLETAHQVAPDIITVVFYGVDQPADIAMLNPWTDVVSVLPPGIKLTMFEWYNRGIKSTGASLWSKEPFVDLTTGWAMDVAAPVRRDRQQIGATVISVNIMKLVDKHLTQNPGRFVLLSAEGAVVGVTPGAQEVIGVHGLSVDIIRKNKENSFVKDENRLGSAQQPTFAQALAAKLAEGKPEFALADAGKTWRFQTAALPEVGFTLVGFTN